ncbi:MAG: hypothetical protein PGN07_11550 [Aeromicrobium erythreum]
MSAYASRAGRPCPRADELRQHGEVEGEHLRVGDVADEALAERRATADGRRTALHGPHAAVAAQGVAQRGDAEPRQVGDARPADGLEDRLGVREGRAEAGRGEHALDRAGDRDAERREQSAPPTADDARAQRQERVGSRRDREQRGERDEGQVGAHRTMLRPGERGGPGNDDGRLPAGNRPSA